VLTKIKHQHPICLRPKKSTDRKNFRWFRRHCR